MIRLVLCLFLSAQTAWAQAPIPSDWRMIPDLTSAALARTGGWELKTSDGFRWDDGRVAFVTYWYGDKAPMIYLRCIDYMNRDFINSSSVCFQPTPR